jgi:hypothetical protein
VSNLLLTAAVVWQFGRDLTIYAITHPAEAREIWEHIRASYEAALAAGNKIAEFFAGARPRVCEVGDDDTLSVAEEAEAQKFAATFGAPRGPFGNGKILKWFLGTPEGQILRDRLQQLLGGMGS